MSKRIKPMQLGDAIAQELSLYHEKINENCYAAGERAVKDLVKKTKVTAPVASGSFKKNIAWKELEKTYRGYRFAWYVKAPDHRITHLVVHGHAGNNHQGNPFLENAMDVVMPVYERDVKEAIKNG